MGVKEEGKTAGVIIASYPAINYEENETGRKHEKEKQLKERGLRGVAGIQIMPSSGRGECYSHSERRSKKYDKAIFHDAIQKAAGEEKQ